MDRIAKRLKDVKKSVGAADELPMNADNQQVFSIGVHPRS
jgi:hypothetical protein